MAAIFDYKLGLKVMCGTFSLCFGKQLFETLAVDFG